jgi:undecaprenyl diphosphate synthase
LILPVPLTEMLDIAPVPRHIAVVMDGNGRWAKRRFLPRVAGHKQGLEAVRALIRGAQKNGVECLTIFAFSSENWQRPPDEVSFLMDLFLRALREEVQKLHGNGIRFRAIGDTAVLSEETRNLIQEAETLTQSNHAFCLNVAVNYGGRWDVEQAVRRAQAGGELATFPDYLAFADQPEPDLFIRTGGERRISNFMLWQLAYTELYFTDTLWPDFTETELAEALRWFATRERRFGKTGDQVRDYNPPISATVAS